MDWIKKNWLSLFAILISITAFFRCEPFVFAESALNWSLGIIVGIWECEIEVLIGESQK